MTIAIDTNIILDILLPDPAYKDSSYSLITKHMKTDRLIISEVVYSELASQFIDEDLLLEFLNDTGIKLVYSSEKALWMASRAWKEYAGARNQYMQCNSCGNKVIIKCTQCHSIITGKQHIISDFIIGGHAFTEAGMLLTRDRGFYRIYFSGLLIQPPT